MYSAPLFRAALLSSAIALTLAVSGCVQSPSITGGSGTALPELTGEITSRSALNVKDGSRYQSFDINLPSAGLWRISASGALSGPLLTALDSQRQLVAGPSENALYLQASKPGRYNLTVSTNSADAYGPFRLNLERLEQLADGARLAVGEMPGAVLTAQKPTQTYPFTVTEPGLYAVSMISDEFDAYLRLKGESVNLENDDGGVGTNARISTYLSAGEYEVEASGVGEGYAGLYTLAVTFEQVPDGVNLSGGGELPLDGSITALMTGESQTYSLQIPRRGFLQVDMRSSDFDSVLEIAGNGMRLSDDDGGENMDARLLMVVEPGEYIIEAQSYAKAGGLFTLTTALSQVSASSSRIRSGEAVTGTLGSDGTARTTLQISQSGRYAIELISNDFDALLNLRGQGVEESDDDSGGGTNARLELLLSPGDYALELTSYEGQGRGDYVVRVTSVR